MKTVLLKTSWLLLLSVDSARSIPGPLHAKDGTKPTLQASEQRSKAEMHQLSNQQDEELKKVIQNIIEPEFCGEPEECAKPGAEAFEKCREQCGTFAAGEESQPSCTVDNDDHEEARKLFMSKVVTCKECKECLQVHGCSSRSVCQCYHPESLPPPPRWCWYDHSSHNFCWTDWFQEPHGRTCANHPLTGWHANNGNFEMTSDGSGGSGCANAPMCQEVLPHLPLCWRDPGSERYCYTESSSGPLMERPSFHKLTVYEKSEGTGSMTQCLLHDAKPCKRTYFDPEHLTCLDPGQKLLDQSQEAQRLYRELYRKRTVCDSKEVGPYYGDNEELPWPNDMQYDGKRVGTCPHMQFHKFDKCWWEAKKRVEHFGEDPDCMIGARCLANDWRGDCPKDMYCSGVTGGSTSACFYEGWWSGHALALGLSALGIAVGVILLGVVAGGAGALLAAVASGGPVTIAAAGFAGPIIFAAPITALLKDRDSKNLSCVTAHDETKTPVPRPPSYFE